MTDFDHEPEPPHHFIETIAFYAFWAWVVFCMSGGFIAR